MTVVAKSLKPFVVFCVGISSLILNPSRAIASDLEVVESFWTESTQPAATTIHPVVEVSRNDRTASFAVTLINRRGKEITGIDGTIGLPTGMQCTRSGTTQASTFYSGIVRVGEPFTLVFPLEITDSFVDQEFRCSLNVDFKEGSDDAAVRQTVNVPLKLTGKTELELVPIGGLSPGSTGPLKFRVSNRGDARATGIRLTLPGVSGVNPGTPLSSISVLGKKTFERIALDPGQSVEWETSVYVNPSAAGSIQSLVASLQYINACRKPVRRESPVGITVFSASKQRFLDFQNDNSPLPVQVGQVSELNLTLVNRSGRDVDEITVSVPPGNETLNVLGRQHWTKNQLPSDGTMPLSISVFASKEMMGRAVKLAFSVQYEVEGQPQTETLDLGLYVEGGIQVRLNDVIVSDIAGVPNLTGNLINEGMETALFSSLELIECGCCSNPPSDEGATFASLYLGDLVENSPLPFSLPLQMSDAPIKGPQDFRLRLRYQNARRQEITRDLSVKASFPPPTEPDAAQQESAADRNAWVSSTGWFLGGIAVGVVLALLARRRPNSDLHRVLQERKIHEGNRIDEALEASAFNASKK